MEVRNMARRRFTLDDKIRIIEELNNGFSHAQVCKKYELSSSTLSTFKRQIDVINATEPKNHHPSAKEKALEDENRKLKELVGKKELELNMLQDLLKKKNYLR
jgi:putative transposase